MPAMPWVLHTVSVRRLPILILPQAIPLASALIPEVESRHNNNDMLVDLCVPLPLPSLSRSAASLLTQSPDKTALDFIFL